MNEFNSKPSSKTEGEFQVVVIEELKQIEGGFSVGGVAGGGSQLQETATHSPGILGFGGAQTVMTATSSIRG